MILLIRTLVALLALVGLASSASPASAREIGNGCYTTNSRAFAAVSNEAFYALSVLVERGNSAGIKRLVDAGYVVILPSGVTVILEDEVVDSVAVAKRAVPVTINYRGKKYVLLSSVIQ